MRRCIRIENVECSKETDNAILIHFDDGEEHWIPKSQISADSEVFEAYTKGDLIVYQWFAEQAELDGDLYEEV